MVLDLPELEPMTCGGMGIPPTWLTPNSLRNISSFMEEIRPYECHYAPKLFWLKCWVEYAT